MNNDFGIEREERGGISILRLAGFLDAHTASRFEEKLQELIDEDRFKIVINFSKLAYISSAGLGVIMGYIEEIRNKGGDIKLSNMSEKVFRIFDLVGFPSLYEIYDSQEEAEKVFNLDGDNKE